MKRIFAGLFFIVATIGVYGQIPSYYNNVNINLSGQSLKNELSNKVINTHTNFLSYSSEVFDVIKQTDRDPNNSSRVLLMYGFNDNDNDSSNDRTRGVNETGGFIGDWNREHVYARSLGSPNLGTSGPGADVHHLRACDMQRNSTRNNRKFAAGSGDSKVTSQGHWYPGDEWKGDVARMMMYMYLRYGNRTLPINVAVGSTVSGDSNMVAIFLQWNAEDPVSQVEKQRNTILENLQGNRNPFIDNPAFATRIWGGPQAEDLFGTTTDTQAPTRPFDLVASNTSQTSTQLFWSSSTDNVGVVGYDVYRNSSYIGTANSAAYSVSGLSSDTTYSFYVVAKDAAGNRSTASSAISVTTESGSTGGGNTLCVSTVNSFPYAESFESGFGNWKQATSDDFNWTQKTGATSSRDTGPSSADAGSFYIYMESSSPNNSNDRAILYGPCYDISSASQATFSFKYHMYGSSSMGSLALEASLDGRNWSSIWSKSGNQGNSWQTASVNLASYAGSTVQLRFNGVTGNTWQGDMAIDNLSFSTTGGGDTGGGDPTTEDVTLQITFDDYPEETSWEIRNSSNRVVYSGGTYGSQADGSTITLSRSLDTGCYTLIVEDAYGDGICCNYGNGSYRLTDSAGGVLASGGSFGDQDNTNFCVGTRTNTSIAETVVRKDGITPEIKVFPNPVQSQLMISLPKSIKTANYQLVNPLGQTLMNGTLQSSGELPVSDLPKGVYLLSISTEGNRWTKQLYKE